MTRGAEIRDRVRASGNLLLARLARSDQMLLEPHARALTLDRGMPLVGPDRVIDAAYFPETALISLEEQIDRDRSVEVGVVGREGMLGWSALLGSGCVSPGAVVRMGPGTLLRIEFGPLCAACARSGSLRATLLQFVDMVIVQMARTIASHLQHTLDQRLARWLLMRHDRIGGDVLIVQHEEIAHCMNVRRASVTDRLHLLEGERLIRCNRGRVLVRDRLALERYAGDAYGATEAHYRSLIGPFGKTVSATAGRNDTWSFMNRLSGPDPMLAPLIESPV